MTYHSRSKTGKPYYLDSTYDIPPIKRLKTHQLRQLEKYVKLLRVHRLLTPQRRDVAKAFLKLVGWQGQTQVALARLADEGCASVATVIRTKDDLIALGMLRVHHIIKRPHGGQGVVQDFSAYELIVPDAASATDLQNANASFLTELRKIIGSYRFVQRMKAQQRRKGWKREKTDREEEEIGRANRDRSLRLLQETLELPQGQLHPPREPVVQLGHSLGKRLMEQACRDTAKRWGRA